MPRTLIIGIGNPLRGDDGLGWRAVEELRQRVSPQSTDTLICHQLVPELAENVSGAEFVIFIDACAGSPPGRIRINRLTPGPPGDSALTHRLDPQSLMQYSRTLYGAWPEALTISMTGADYGYSESLSPQVESQLPALVEMAAQAIAQGPAWLREQIAAPGCAPLSSRPL